MAELDNGFVAPALIAEVDDDVIHERMLENLPDDIDKTEGGFAYDFTRPAALEKAELLIGINDAIQVFFPAWSYGDYLDKIAAQDGLTRKSATYAEAYLNVFAATGAVIPEGFRWSTASTAISSAVEFETVESVTADSDGNAVVHVRCTEAGVIGNVPANSITLMSVPSDEIFLISNPEAAAGGADVESDDDLRTRIEEKDRSGEVSFVGCDADYMRWAKEVDGVGDVSVIPEWMGKGTGTVKLIVMDSNGSPATQSLLTQVYNHIISEQDRDNRLAPVGAVLTVVTAVPVQISITAAIKLETSATIENVTTVFISTLREYFATAKSEGEIKYTRVGSKLSETAGVADYENLTINGGDANVIVNVDDYPEVRSVTFTEVS